MVSIAAQHGSTRHEMNSPSPAGMLVRPRHTEWLKHAPIDDGIRKHGRVSEITLAVADRDIYAFLYSSHRWQRLRAVAVRLHPLCDRCRLSITEIVDHRIPAGVVIVQAQQGAYLDKYAGFFFLSNLQGLCRACHHAKTLEDKAHVGAWPDAVAVESASVKRRWTF